MHRSRLYAARLNRAGIAVVLLALVLTGSASEFFQVSVGAAQAEHVDVGMPFDGKWGYNVLVSPPYTDGNSSHPSVHARYGMDWAADLYAGAGTQVRLRFANAT